MQTSILIIGQGLCGTWLSYYLHQAGIPFLVIDNNKNHTASKVASGIINPVTGRRLVKTWMIDKVMPFAVDAYQKISLPGLIKKCNVLDFFSAPDVEIAYNKRLEEHAAHVSLISDKEPWRQYFYFDFGIGAIEPCYLVDVNGLLSYWRTHLQQQKLLLQNDFNENDLVIQKEHICYQNIEAKNIIYCNGTDAIQSKYFSRLPFAVNKGEAVIAEIPDLPATHIYKKGMSLIPWKPGQYWVGSTYQWKFDNEFSSNFFRENAEKWLKSFCKLPYQIIDHFAAVRPSTIERRPFIGLHPTYPQIGIFNGMGTKGVSLAPFFAKQFSDYLSYQIPFQPDVSIQRFVKIIGR